MNTRFLPRASRLTQIAAVAALIVVGGTAMAAQADATDAAAASYCTSTGGVASIVHPFANTNADASQWIQYGGTTTMCTYTATDGSSIEIFASTLNSTKPTMAALAYYAMVPSTVKGGNPGDGYCVQLGGVFNIGVPGTGSMWTKAAGDVVGDMCVFGDGSAIDTFGLFYHSAAIVRGQDLSTVLKFANPY